MTTQNETPTPRTDVVWRQLEEADSITETGAAAGAVVVLARQLERELAKAEADLEPQIDAKMRLAKELEDAEKRNKVLHMALGDAIKERDQLKNELAEAKAERDAARIQASMPDDYCLACGGRGGHTNVCPGATGLIALTAERDQVVRQWNAASDAAALLRKERDQWQECAEAFIEIAKGAPIGPRYIKARDQFDRLCQSPTPSSPSPSPDYYSSQATILMHDHDPHKQSSPSSPPTAPASNAPASVPATPDTASRLAALERSQELLLRRTDTLMALFSELKMFLDLLPDVRWTWSSKTEWPADLVPTASTSISQPTPKPSGSANESSM